MEKPQQEQSEQTAYYMKTVPQQHHTEICFV